MAAVTDLTCEVDISEEEIERIKIELEEDGKSSYTIESKLLNTAGIAVAKNKCVHTILSRR